MLKPSRGSTWRSFPSAPGRIAPLLAMFSYGSRRMLKIQS
jgi:hypothetical protein